ncbi:hypothetical protein [Variovorax sp. RCC_210]|uniref:hypothetical protein n=1 Tax=Variovorax sp. RCC_210 TaxID=3239217 RepID=UPI003525459D
MNYLLVVQVFVRTPYPQNWLSFRSAPTALNSDGTISKTKRKRYSEDVSEEVFAAIEREAHGVLHPAAGLGTGV